MVEFKIGEVKKRKAAPAKAKKAPGKAKKKASAEVRENGYQTGDVFRCADCGKEHVLFEGTDPEQFFYYCGDKLKLGAMGRFAFV